MSPSADVLNLATLPSDIVRTIVSMESEWEPNKAIRLISQQWNVRMQQCLIEMKNNKRPITLLMYPYLYDCEIIISGNIAPTIHMRCCRSDLKQLRMGTMIVPRSFFEKPNSEILFTMPLFVSDECGVRTADGRIARMMRRCSKIEILDINISLVDDLRRCLQHVPVECLSATLGNPPMSAQIFDKNAGQIILSLIRDHRVKHLTTSASSVTNANDLQEFIIEAMKYLKSLQIMEPMKYNDSTDTESTYFGRSRDFWNNFTGMLNKCGNFEVAFSVEDSHAFFIHASIYITAKDRGLTMMDLALD